MHNKIICITKDINDCCPIDGTDFERISGELGADYMGDRLNADEIDEELEDYLSEFVTSERCTTEDEYSDITHRLILNEEATRKKVADWLEHFKQVVADTTLEQVLEDTWQHGRYAIDKAFRRKVFCEEVIYWDYEFMSITDFAIKWLKCGADTPLYVCGVIDYHW